MAEMNKEGIKLLPEDKFVLANFSSDEAFTLALSNVQPQHIMNVIGHLAVLLETRASITIEEIAKRLIEDQGSFSQREGE